MFSTKTYQMDPNLFGGQLLVALTIFLLVYYSGNVVYHSKRECLLCVPWAVWARALAAFDLLDRRIGSGSPLWEPAVV